VPGYQDNAIIFWKIYPPYIRDMFTQAFTKGLHNSKARIVEKQWKDAFASLRNSILYCPNCGSENFYNKQPRCWQCKSSITPPPRIRLGRQLVMLNHDTNLTAHHLIENFDFKTEIGKISRHPQNPNRWGLTNVGGDNWTLYKPNGESVVIEPGRTVPLQSNAKINFGVIEGTIE
jgi:hypothetical protein